MDELSSALKHIFGQSSPTDLCHTDKPACGDRSVGGLVLFVETVLPARTSEEDRGQGRGAWTISEMKTWLCNLRNAQLRLPMHLHNHVPSFPTIYHHFQAFHDFSKL